MRQMELISFGLFIQIRDKEEFDIITLTDEGTYRQVSWWRTIDGGQSVLTR